MHCRVMWKKVTKKLIGPYLNVKWAIPKGQVGVVNKPKRLNHAPKRRDKVDF